MEIYYVSLGEAINYCDKYLIKRGGMDGSTSKVDG
jgi:hypothetical protein